MLCRSWTLVALLTSLACHPSAEATATPVEAARPSSPAASPPIAVDAARMLASLDVLASDAMKGRFTLADEDLGRAADYLAGEYAKVALRPVGPAFRVPFDLEAGREPGPDLHLWLESADEVIEVPDKDYASLASGDGTAAFGSATYVGDKAPKSVKGRIAIARVQQEAATTLITERARALHNAGARAVVMIVPARPITPDRIDVEIPVVIVAEADAQRLLPTQGLKVGAQVPGFKVSLAPQQVPVMHPSFNVLAWIPGSVHPEQIVILGAHYDHIGTSGQGSHCGAQGPDTVCNGADDNGSGTAMVLEIARSMAEAGYRPQRSLVFAHFAGEELGLHGSRALADNPPDAAPFDDGKVVAMINLDMVGRYRDSEGLQVGGISSSDGWRPLLDDAGNHGMRLIFERSVTGRSDHANFYRKKIPVLFFFTGLHDDYHAAGDHVEKINGDAMGEIAEIVAHLTAAVADGAALPWTEPRSPNEGEVSRLPGSDAKTVEAP